MSLLPKNPLGEVFGFPPSSQTPQAQRHRKNRLCPFNNISPNCTKDRVTDPLGVCSLRVGNELTVICPVRFNEDSVILEHAAGFFFPTGEKWTSVREVRLPDEEGRSAGNIDFVLIALNRDNEIADFGALEVQSVYISGNIRDPFAEYMRIADQGIVFDWGGQPKYPRPDYLSSSRKRLLPQLMYKGGILNAWGKKTAVVVSRDFFGTLPAQTRVAPDDAELAWLVYDLVPNEATSRYHLTLVDTVLTRFSQSLDSITRTRAGSLDAFVDSLRTKLKRALPMDDATDGKPLDPSEEFGIG